MTAKRMCVDLLGRRQGQLLRAGMEGMSGGHRAGCLPLCPSGLLRYGKPPPL